MAASLNSVRAFICLECAAEIPAHFVSGMKEYPADELWPLFKKSLIGKRVSFVCFLTVGRLNTGHSSVFPVEIRRSQRFRLGHPHGTTGKLNSVISFFYIFC